MANDSRNVIILKKNINNVTFLIFEFIFKIRQIKINFEFIFKIRLKQINRKKINVLLSDF